MARRPRRGEGIVRAIEGAVSAGLRFIVCGFWLQADLAGPRDAAALEKLPDAEHAEWKKLWAEVEELLKKSGESGKK